MHEKSVSTIFRTLINFRKSLILVSCINHVAFLGGGKPSPIHQMLKLCIEKKSRGLCMIPYGFGSLGPVSSSKEKGS